MGIKIYISPPKTLFEEQNLSDFKRKLQDLLSNTNLYSVDEFLHYGMQK